jgi:hypothetical protein
MCEISRYCAGTGFDVTGYGRAESTGCVNSGRRWHRRIPSQVVDFARPLLSLGEMSMRTTTRLAASLVLALTISGCALAVRHPSVAELKYNPGRYQDRTVAIDGIVTSSWGVPLVPFRLYKVDDGTGEVTVVAQNGRVPTKGAHVRVTGRVNEFATLGGQSVGLHIRQDDIDFRSR